MSTHLLFVAAGANFALRTEHVKAVHTALQLRSVVGTCHWFLGLALSQGKLLPVTDLGAFAGAKPSGGASIELQPSLAIAALRVDNVSGASSALLNDGSNKLAVPACDTLQEFITGETVSDKSTIHYVLNIQSLVQSKRFNNIKEYEVS